MFQWRHADGRASDGEAARVKPRRCPNPARPDPTTDRTPVRSAARSAPGRRWDFGADLNFGGRLRLYTAISTTGQSRSCIAAYTCMPPGWIQGRLRTKRPLACSFDGVSVQPLLVLEKPSQRKGDLSVLIAFGTGWKHSPILVGASWIVGVVWWPKFRRAENQFHPRLGGLLVISAILILPKPVSRSPPMASSIYPSSIRRVLCSGGMRCIKPLAPSRNETNSSRVNGGADKLSAIPRMCAFGWPVQASYPATIKPTTTRDCKALTFRA
jgi:hypothetical protein